MDVSALKMLMDCLLSLPTQFPTFTPSFLACGFSVAVSGAV